jgi:lipoprotein NlpD
MEDQRIPEISGGRPVSPPRRQTVRAATWHASIAAALALSCAHRSAAPRNPAPPIASPSTPEHREPDLVQIRHRVEPGQTLYRIARMYGISPEALASANRISDPSKLAPGQELTVPVIAKPEFLGEGVDNPSGIHPAVANAPIGKGATRDRNYRGDLDWPLRGVLYARFGKRGKEVHDGIDLAAPRGTPIKTAQEGTVIYAGEQKGYGLITIVAHQNGLVTLYAHNSDLRVKTGQHVRRGQVIATVGESGRTTGPHLHFEVRKDGVPVDPLDHLGPLPDRS